MKLNENVKNLLNNTKTWVMSTKGDTPNAVPILFKKVNDDDSLILLDVFMKTSLENIKSNSQAAVSVWDESTLEGYQLKGLATYTTDPAVVEAGNAITSKFNLTTKGAVIVKVNEVTVLTPGPDNGKKIII